jgi:CheY-like chemotaxis protein
LEDAAELSAAEPPEFDAQPFLLRHLVDDLQARWTGSSGSTPLLAAYEGDAELCVLGDKARLGQVLDALVGRAAGRTRGAVEATLAARAQSGRVQLVARVRDDLSPARPADLFGLDPTGGGSLSRALAARLLSRMGGQLSVQLNAGTGATVSFELDLPEAHAGSAEIVDAAPDGPRLHVLIVDDNATNRLVAEAFCDMFGCSSDSAEDGLEALEAVNVRRYDVILMDVKMPRMDGLEATRAIRAMRGPAAQTPIVALTANADPEDIRRYVAAGMAGVVEKPIKADRLAEVLNAVLAAGQSPEGQARAA